MDIIWDMLHLEILGHASSRIIISPCFRLVLSSDIIYNILGRNSHEVIHPKSNTTLAWARLLPKFSLTYPPSKVFSSILSFLEFIIY